MTTTKNRYDSLLQKLFKIKSEFEKTKLDLVIIKESNDIIVANNEEYKLNIIQLREKLHLYQKQETEKLKNLETELVELRKYYHKALQNIQELKENKENKKN